MPPKKPCTNPNCKKGKSCPNLHSSPAKDPKLSPGVVCSYHLAGNCIYGSKCRNSHYIVKSPRQDKKIATTANSSKGNQTGKGKEKQKSGMPSKGDQNEARVVDEAANEETGDGSGFKQVSAPNNVPTTKALCYFPDTCDGKCGFSHEQPDDSDQDDSKSCSQHSTHSQESPRAASPPAASVRGDPDGDCDEQPEEYPSSSEQNDHQQDDSASNAADEDNAGPQFGVDQLPEIPKLQLNNIRPTVVTNRMGRQRQTLPAPAQPSASPVYSSQANRPSEPVMASMPPHISDVKLHWSQFADPYANSEIPFCKLHARSACLSDDPCPFRHSLTIQEYATLFHDQQPTLATLRKEQDSNPAVSPACATDSSYEAPVSVPTVARPAAVQPIPTSVPSRQRAQETRPSTSIPECSFYMLGKCRNGDQCPFGHTKHPPPELINSGGNPRKGCHFFVKGSCANGENCPYLHENTSDTQPYIPTPPASENHTWGENENNDRWGKNWGEGDDSGWNKKTTDANNGGWNQERDDSAWYESSNSNMNGNLSGNTRRPSSNPEYQKKPCFPFHKNGYCRFGDDCRYSHGEEQAIPNGRDNDQADAGYQLPENQEASQDLDPPSNSHYSEQVSKNGDNEGDLDAGLDITDETWKTEPTAESTNEESNTDNDNGWSAEWSQETAPSDPPAKSRRYCKEFGQGVGCKKGDNCCFIHDDPNSRALASTGDVAQPTELPELEEVEDANDVDDIVDDTGPVSSETEESDIGELEPITFDHPKVQKFMLGSTTIFGPDSTPEAVETLADSRRLRLSNLPPGTPVEDIRLLVDSFGGTPREGSLRATEYSTTVTVEFPDAKKARVALKSLHRQTPAERMIIASLLGSAKLRFRVPSERPTLKISWPKPSQIGWGHYPNIRKAKEEADRLNGVILKGRTIHVEVCPHDKRQKDNFAIKFSNLAPETNKHDVEQLCNGHTIVTLGDGPTYTGNVTDKIKGEIRDFGEYDFDMLPDIPENATLTAFVTFTTDAIAAQVVADLRSRQLEFLGNQTLDTKHVYFSCYRVDRGIFALLKPEVDRLKEKGGNAYTLQYNEHFDAFYIRLSATSNKQAAFVDANTELWTLLQGQIAESEDGITWDDYFETSSSEKALQHLKTKAIIPDKVGKCIRIFGSKEDQANAKAQLQKLLSKVRDAYHELDIPQGAIRPLVDGQFQTLLKTIQGKNKLSFDIFRSKITLKGTDEDLKKVRQFVESLDQLPVKYKRGCCEICYQKAEEPIRLSCHHSYCKPCLRMAVVSARHAPLHCKANLMLDSGDAESCPSYVPYTIIHNLLSESTEEDMLRSSLLVYIHNSDEFFTCPSVGCETILRSGEVGWNVLCSRCRTEICSFCKVLGHIGISCDDMKEKGLSRAS